MQECSISRGRGQAIEDSVGSVGSQVTECKAEICGWEEMVESLELVKATTAQFNGLKQGTAVA